TFVPALSFKPALICTLLPYLGGEYYITTSKKCPKTRRHLIDAREALLIKYSASFIRGSVPGLPGAPSRYSGGKPPDTLGWLPCRQETDTLEPGATAPGTRPPGFESPSAGMSRRQFCVARVYLGRSPDSGTPSRNRERFRWPFETSLPLRPRVPPAVLPRRHDSRQRYYGRGRLPLALLLRVSGRSRVLYRCPHSSPV